MPCTVSHKEVRLNSSLMVLVFEPVTCWSKVQLLDHWAMLIASSSFPWSLMIVLIATRIIWRARRYRKWIYTVDIYIYISLFSSALQNGLLKPLAIPSTPKHLMRLPCVTCLSSQQLSKLLCPSLSKSLFFFFLHLQGKEAPHHVHTVWEWLFREPAVDPAVASLSETFMLKKAEASKRRLDDVYTPLAYMDICVWVINCLFTFPTASFLQLRVSHSCQAQGVLDLHGQNRVKLISTGVHQSQAFIF